MMVDGLLDTTVLVDLLRGYPPAKEWITLQSPKGITPIVYLELLEGASNRFAQQQVFKLLRLFPQISLQENDFSWAIESLTQYQLSHQIGAFDALIAAPCYRLQIPLYTQNLKHFMPMLGSLVRKPYP